RGRPSRDESVVAGKLGANINPALSIGPKQDTACASCKGRITVTLAHYGIQVGTLFARQHRSLHAQAYGYDTSNFNDSMD
ncbi:hypothetical protein PO002_38060, partial [Cupriavidus necator]|uniref:hypothetical protein n=1 Tax=Cupriavidus necator TaxID=106590 RepID=UPI0039C42575